MSYYFVWEKSHRSGIFDIRRARVDPDDVGVRAGVLLPGPVLGSARVVGRSAACGGDFDGRSWVVCVGGRPLMLLLLPGLLLLLPLSLEVLMTLLL